MPAIGKPRKGSSPTGWFPPRDLKPKGKAGSGLESHFHAVFKPVKRGLLGRTRVRGTGRKGLLG